MHTFLAATLVLEASVVTPAFGTPIEFAVVPLKLAIPTDLFVSTDDIVRSIRDRDTASQICDPFGELAPRCNCSIIHLDCTNDGVNTLCQCASSAGDPH
jgi:hypothetical protein